MNPTATRRAIYGKLAGDSTLNGLLASPPAGWSKSIYYNQAPDGAPFPFVIFSRQSGIATYTNVTKPAFELDIWLVKGVDRSATADTAEAISARIDALLTDASLSISGSTLLYLRRQSDVDYPEVTDNIRYVHSGSLYRLVFEPQ